jgi:hypothetical protein
MPLSWTLEVLIRTLAQSLRADLTTAAGARCSLSRRPAVLHPRRSLGGPAALAVTASADSCGRGTDGLKKIVDRCIAERARFDDSTPAEASVGGATSRRTPRVVQPPRYGAKLDGVAEPYGSHSNSWSRIHCRASAGSLTDVMLTVDISEISDYSRLLPESDNISQTCWYNALVAR